jgi:hypothetical protein
MKIFKIKRKISNIRNYNQEVSNNQITPKFILYFAGFIGFMEIYLLNLKFNEQENNIEYLEEKIKHLEEKIKHVGR